MAVVITRPSTTSSARQDLAAVRPVRVCFLIDELARAGTEGQLLALIQRLDRRRVEPTLCLLRGDSPASRALEPADCPVWRLGVGALRSPRSLLAAWRFVKRLRAARIDVVQAYFPDSTYFGLILAQLAGVRHRLRTRNNLGHWLTPRHRLLGRLFNRFATGVLTNCEAARRALVQTEALPPETVAVLENGVDLERFLTAAPLRARDAADLCRIGAVANLRPVKGVDVLVEAASLLRQRAPRAVFAVAGEGEQRGDLERQIASHELSDRFKLMGVMRDVPSFLGSVDVAVLPSRSEGMSNALLEYMAAGRAIVAANVGAASELIEDGEHGLLVPADNPQALAEALAALIHEPARAQRLGAAARRRARQRYSRATMVRRFEDYYQGLIAADGPQSD
jgi:glycosyltransferase involved in cell wall biosynthesis